MPPLKSSKTPFQCFKDKWKDGCGAIECSRSTNKVIIRGCIPSDILFIGEAPGDSENSLGLPFIGPMGHKLDSLISKTVGRYNSIRRVQRQLPELRVGIINVVGCIPTDEDSKKSGQPSEDQLISCHERTQELITLVDPSLVIAVGTIARDRLDHRLLGSLKLPQDCKSDWIYHPSFISRQNIAQQGLLWQKCQMIILDMLDQIWQ